MTNLYNTPFNSRYSSKEMSYIFSDDMKFSTWRKLWVALAEGEKELGIDITEEQLNELKENIFNINYDEAIKKEKEVRHDVMSHVHAYGLQCPNAKGIIHLGATSCYVGDNTDIIIMRDGLLLIKEKIVAVLNHLSNFALEYKSMPTLGFTHFQPAQPTTVGKRATLWIQDLLYDIEECDFFLSTLQPLGSKGTTGTQASFLSLFDGDYEKVKKLDDMIAQKMGFTKSVAVSGQTYSRKVDSRALNALSQIAQSAYKFSNDIRLLAHMKQVEEPFAKEQIGSSAMAYKRNPMRSERIASLSRFLMNNAQNAAMTASAQWFERTLDDSANRRLSLAEGFLCCDSILDLYSNVADGLVVYEKVIEKHLNSELPFMATENIMMEAVAKGGNRQELHERIRVHSMDAGRVIKEEGGTCDLLERIANDPVFDIDIDTLRGSLRAEDYTGCSAQQTLQFLNTQVKDCLDKYQTVEVQKVDFDV